MYHSAQMEVMGQSMEVSSLLSCGCGDQPQAVRLGDKHLFWLSHCAAPDICLLMLCIPKKYQRRLVFVYSEVVWMLVIYKTILSWNFYLYKETKVERIAFVQFQQVSCLLDPSLNYIQTLYSDFL